MSFTTGCSPTRLPASLYTMSFSRTQAIHAYFIHKGGGEVDRGGCGMYPDFHRAFSPSHASESPQRTNHTTHRKPTRDAPRCTPHSRIQQTGGIGLTHPPATTYPCAFHPPTPSNKKKRSKKLWKQRRRRTSSSEQGADERFVPVHLDVAHPQRLAFCVHVHPVRCPLLFVFPLCVRACLFLFSRASLLPSRASAVVPGFAFGYLNQPPPRFPPPLYQFEYRPKKKRYDVPLTTGHWN